MRALVAAALVLSLLLVAGCSSLEAPDPPAEDGSQAPEGGSEPVPPEPGPEPGATVGGEPVPAEATPDVVVFRVEGNTTANAAMWGLDTVLLVGIRSMDVYVPSTTHAAVFEVSWDDAVQDLDLEIHPRYGDAASAVDCGPLCDRDGHLGAPDSPIRIVLDRAAIEAYTVAGCEPETPEWGECNVWVPGLRSKDANALLHYRVAVSLFATDVPEGYSAL